LNPNGKFKGEERVRVDADGNVEASSLEKQRFKEQFQGLADKGFLFIDRLGRVS